ncbi:tetratricopeptide repeat protein [Xanthomarina sp.]|uniref:tetratricopeptide repeat protein n=1 Tax=Xanthomarina TaxID=1868329 RepID=UPI0025794EE4|nr:tetratricopeptide repeat protein [Xanthomarina sp.]
MKTSIYFSLFFMLLVSVSCSKSIDYPSAFKEASSGRYLYSPDELMEVFYKNDQLYIKWKGAEIKPVVLDQHTFFVPDLYQKLQFVQHPETKQRYLSVITEASASSTTYNYIKVSDTFKTPSMYLRDKAYGLALEGYLNIQAEDPESMFIIEQDFNSLGYQYLREKAYADAIEVFKINVALYPESDNVYDSLADAYARSGDSLQAYQNYEKALELNSGNRRAKTFMDSYENQQD